MTDPRVATGRLHFEDWKPGTPPRPLHHFDVELWARGPVGAARRLAAGVTDLEGAFALPFAPPAGHGQHGLELRLYELARTWSPEGAPVDHRHLVHVIDAGELDGAGPVALGDLAVPYWPYCYGGPLPRVHVPPGGPPPQDYPRGRKVALMKATSAIGVARARHLAIARQTPHLPALAAIQADYPENLTMRLERERPGATRSDAFFADRVLNGFNPCLPVADARHPGEVRVGFAWDDCEMDGEHVLPNADAWFAERDGRLVPTRIALRFRLPGGTAAGSPLGPERTFTPADGEDWERAKRLFRCAWSLDGQITGHLTKAHLNVEQYAVAAYRNLRRSPLRDLLLPHLKDVVVINHGGTDLIFGERGYVTVASALTAEAIGRRFVGTLGGLDWRGWRPRRPLGPDHVYGLAANLFWEVLGRHVDEFFAAHGEAIAREWPEVRRFSDDVVQHAVAWVPPARAPYDEPADLGELGDEAAPRASVDGVVRAVRPVTTTDAPAAGELAALAQLCRYVIFHATFFHAWANDRQHDDGGELRYAALSLRGDGWGPEDDAAIAQAPAEATDQLFLAMYLQHTRYGFLLKNEDHDVPHRFVELLGERAEAFRAIGFDPGTIRSCINI